MDEAQVERRTLELRQEHAWILLDLAMIGFATLVAGEELHHPMLRGLFLEELNSFRPRLPLSRTLVVMEALTAMHPNRAGIQPFLDQLKEKLGHGG